MSLSLEVVKSIAALPVPTRGVPYRAIASSSLDPSVVLYGRANSVLFRSPITGEVFTSYAGHVAKVTCIIAAEGGVVVSGDSQGWVRVWRERGSELHSYRLFASSVRGLGLSPDGKTLVACCEGARGGGGVVVDLATGKSLGEVGGHSKCIMSVTFPAPGVLVTGGEDHVLVWHRGPPYSFFRSSNVHRNFVSSLLSLGEWVVSGGQDCRVVLHSALMGETLGEQGVGGSVWALCPMGGGLGVLCGKEPHLRILRLPDLIPLTEISLGTPCLGMTTLSPDSVCVVGHRGELLTCSSSTSKGIEARLEGSNGQVTSLCPAPGGGCYYANTCGVVAHTSEGRVFVGDKGVLACTMVGDVLYFTGNDKGLWNYTRGECNLLCTLPSAVKYLAPQAGGLVYISASGQVWRYDIAKGVLEEGVDLGGAVTALGVSEGTGNVAVALERRAKGMLDMRRELQVYHDCKFL